MDRRLPSPTALLCLIAAPLMGCGSGQGSAPGQPTDAGALDLLQSPGGAWLEFETPPTRAQVLLRGADLSTDQWSGSVRLTATPAAQEQAAFDTLTHVRPGGLIEMGAPRGILAHLLPLPDDVAWIEVSGLIQTSGLSGQFEDSYARLGAFQVDISQWDGDPRALQPHIVANHFCTPQIENTSAPVPIELRMRRDPRARGLVLVTEFVDQRPDPRGMATFAALRVSSMGSTERTLEVAEEILGPAVSDDRPRLARFAVDLVHRYGYALPVGAQLVLPIDSAPGGRTFEFYAAAMGAEREGDWLLRCHWAHEDGTDEPLTRATIALEVDDDPETAPAGWRRISAELPTSAAGGAILISVDGAGRGDLSNPSVPIIASPRLLAVAPAPARPNLLMVSLDTVRADHLGAYGGDARLSPSFDALAAESTLFLDAWSTAPYTLPAHMSLFSGQHPSVHGVHRPSQRRDRRRTPMLAELMGAAGYRTAAFTGGAMVLPTFGFAAGFERYGALDPWINTESERTRALLAGLPGLSDRALGVTGLDAVEAQLDHFGGSPWFLFVHTYAAHEFDPPARHLEAIDAAEGLAADDPRLLLYLANAQEPPPEVRARLEQLYAAGVRHADEMLGDLLARLEARGELENTVVVVLSDHGKEIGDHGVVGHGHVLYEELVAVPLVIRVPGREPQVSRTPAQLIDVLPTLCGLLDLPAPAGMQGHDLFGAEPLPPDRPLWAEVDGLVKMRALRVGPSKTIERFPSGVLYFDLDRDPYELSPLAGDAAALARLRDFGEQLERTRSALPSEGLAISALDEADRAQLEALGYFVNADGSFTDRD